LVNEFNEGKRYNFDFDAMKHDIPISITVRKPLAGVTMMVQCGRSELLSPAQKTPEGLVFEFEVVVDLSSGVPNFLGPFAQGPKTARFIYVNSGTYAGQHVTGWARRAKISLMGVTDEQIETVLETEGAMLHAEFQGIGRDGGPTCATVKGVEWGVVTR
jgi:hypothetical protein